MTAQEISNEMADATNLVGVLLVLLTLFTSEQGRRLAEERKRLGGADRRTLRIIFWLSIGLMLVTLSSIGALFPLVRDIAGALGTASFKPVFGIFALVWVLLIALFVWQVSLARASFR